MQEPTKTQKSILEHIQQAIRRQGFPPTLREIGEKFKIESTGSVAYHLKALENLGLLKRTGSAARGLKPLEGLAGLPILGRVGAGAGVIAEEDIEGHFSPEQELSRAHFLLKVRGDSMTGAGIFPGDMVMVRRQKLAEDGEIVVALVAEETEGVVKRIKKIGHSWELHSENPEYHPIRSPFTIVGKVVGLIRRYSR